MKKFYFFFSKTFLEIFCFLVLKEGIRLDGRKTDQIRDIWTEVGYLPSTHGSAVFTRGETQSLGVVTLGTSVDEKLEEGLNGSEKKKYFFHYNFGLRDRIIHQMQQARVGRNRRRLIKFVLKLSPPL